MAFVYALPKLFDDVVALFAAESTLIPNLFGWREPAKQFIDASRICWVPGDASGKSAIVEPPKFPGRNPRPLWTVVEAVTFEVYGFDASDPENELKQYKAVIAVRDALLRAIYLKAHGTVKVQDLTWIKPERMQRRHGAALKILATIENMVPDAAMPIAGDGHCGVGANIAVTELDVTEPVIVEVPPCDFLITEDDDFITTEDDDLLLVA